MIQAQKFNYSGAHIKKPLITPTQKTFQCIQFIGNLTDFALNGLEHFAPPSPLPWSSVHSLHLIEFSWLNPDKTIKVIICRKTPNHRNLSIITPGIISDDVIKHFFSNPKFFSNATNLGISFLLSNTFFKFYSFVAK